MTGAVKLSARGLSKSFALRGGQTIQAVQYVDFDVHENEFCVLLGPSGCGKSTVLRMIAGLEEPTEGRLELDGHEIQRPDRERGMVFQGYTSFDWLTVQKNVEYGMKLNGVPAADRRAQKPGLMMANIYRTLLREIESQGFRVLHQRTSLTPLRKLWIATRTHWQGR